MTLLALVVKNPSVSAGDIRDAGLISASGRSPGVGSGNPLQHSCLENPIDRGAWQATVHGVAKSQTWLKRLNTHTYMTLSGVRCTQIQDAGICSEAVEKEGCGRPQDGAHQAAGEMRCGRMMEEELFESAASTRRSRAHRRATAYGPGGPGLVTERCGVDSSQVEMGVRPTS